ncbi:MAG TPA: helix-turn-helix domain-containing protein, partial [Bacteroidota bacterium]
YDWPGNVRELRNCLERATIVTDSELIRPEHLSIHHQPAAGGSAAGPPAADTISFQLDFDPAEISLDAITRRVLDITLERCGGNKSKAADLLRVNRKMFYR